MKRFPRMCDVRQRFDSTVVTNIESTVREQLSGLQLQKTVSSGQSVAITAGSRGIANIALILKTVVSHFRELGAEPFIVPAMGSHGGGTIEGQTEVLRGLGITESTVGAPIRATMDTVVVTETENGVPVHFDRLAHEADHTFIVNRIKPHTRFVGPVESGLHKMLLIGLGKHNGARIYHQAIHENSFPEIIDSVAAKVLQQCGVAGGIAILENAKDETALIEGVMPSDFAGREPDLLKKAIDWLPTLPFDYADLLIVDRIGKNISGVGMDANTVGRKFNDHAATEKDSVNCLRIMVRSLTEETHGNASGIGMAEFTTDQCVAGIDHKKTRVNCVTANHPEAAMIPIVMPTDADAVNLALQTIGMVEPADARVIQISDTLHLTTTRVSEAYFPLVETSDRLDFVGQPYDFPVDESGGLLDVPVEE